MVSPRRVCDETVKHASTHGLRHVAYAVRNILFHAWLFLLLGAFAVFGFNFYELISLYLKEPLVARLSMVCQAQIEHFPSNLWTTILVDLPIHQVSFRYILQFEPIQEKCALSKSNCAKFGELKKRQTGVFT